jgi:hypothetical protein
MASGMNAVGRSGIHLMQKDQGTAWGAAGMRDKCPESVLVWRSELGVLACAVCH